MARKGGNPDLGKTVKPASRHARMFYELGLPNLLSRYAKGVGSGRGTKPHWKPVESSAFKFRGVLYWKTLARNLKKTEQALCIWEDANPQQYRELPWYEAREQYKAAKARGEVRDPTWWEIAGACSAAGANLLPGRFK